MRFKIPELESIKTVSYQGYTYNVAITNPVYILTYASPIGTQSVITTPIIKQIIIQRNADMFEVKNNGKLVTYHIKLYFVTVTGKQINRLIGVPNDLGKSVNDLITQVYDEVVTEELQECAPTTASSMGVGYIYAPFIPLSVMSIPTNTYIPTTASIQLTKSRYGAVIVNDANV